MKLITFAVPCYNSAEYMDKCIESLLVAGDDAEIIIVNDGSTKDNTKEKADEWASKYPNIIKAIHQENGGHGEAVNTGLKNATGVYYKVVDSDDWLDKDALLKLMDTIRSFNENGPDVIIANYVYEHVYNNTRKFIRYTKEFPVEKLFEFEESHKFAYGKFMMMHSIVYKTSLLHEVGLKLPKHTFYVDNIFVYHPLPYAKTFYYLNVDLYRYFIGRPDQSVNEQILTKRIDQHIRMTEIFIGCHKVSEYKNSRPKLYKYMLDYLSIMMTINSIFLIKIGDKESYSKKRALWDLLKQSDEDAYKKCKKKFVGMVNSDNKCVCVLCKFLYKVARVIFKFN
ncbi:MAG: glycosyltransferase family 2 protein [Clostridiales bacterium]|nr:glycosyltransferase family 2 protein [Clostridiales bacterium]